MKKIILCGFIFLLLLGIVGAVTVRIGDKTAIITSPSDTKTVSSPPPVVFLNEYVSSVALLQMKNNELQEKVKDSKFKYDVLLIEVSKITLRVQKIEEENKVLKEELCKVNDKYLFCIKG